MFHIFQKGSTFTEAINEEIHSLHEIGLIEKWIKDLVANSSNCDTVTKIVDSHGKALQSFSMEQMQSFFYIIFGGLALSALVFTTEVLKGKLQSEENVCCLDVRAWGVVASLRFITRTLIRTSIPHVVTSSASANIVTTMLKSPTATSSGETGVSSVPTMSPRRNIPISPRRLST